MHNALRQVGGIAIFSKESVNALYCNNGYTQLQLGPKRRHKIEQITMKMLYMNTFTLRYTRCV